MKNAAYTQKIRTKNQGREETDDALMSASLMIPEQRTKWIISAAKHTL